MTNEWVFVAPQPREVKPGIGLSIHSRGLGAIVASSGSFQSGQVNHIRHGNRGAELLEIAVDGSHPPQTCGRRYCPACRGQFFGGPATKKAFV